jgi:hypothetical protein
MLLHIASLMLASSGSPAPTIPPGPPALEAELRLGSTAIERRIRPLDHPDWLEAGQTVYAWTQVTGPGGGYVEHVWYRDGQEVAHHYLPLGKSKRWRTWSRHRLQVGQYQVKVLGPDGKCLRELSFIANEPLRD